MRVYLFLLAVVIAFSSCKRSFVIEGYVDNVTFWDSKVYLVALDGPISKRVDSTLAVNGNFRFEIPADSMEVRIVRIAPKYPEMVEDLVVVAEPGTMNVKLGNKSFGRGTPINDRLQHWKERKGMFDSIQWSLLRQKRELKLSPNEKDSLEAYSQDLYELFVSENVCTIHENLNNGIGLLLFKLYYDVISSDDKNSILDNTGMKYFNRDRELKKRIEILNQE